MSVSKDLVDIIKSSDDKGTKGYDTTATVTRVDGGTVWVHIPGGVDETPVKRTINANAGDVVQVRVSGGSAWLNGNASAPPTDDTTAIKADTTATEAKQLSDVAYMAAESAVDSAGRAADAASRAETSAGNALTAAQSAQTSADSALVSLSTVEDVVGVLNWITAHGTMTLTSDVAVNPAHVYFIVDPAGDYVVGGTHYSIVAEPKDADISTYYELSVDESVQNYVATHVVVDTEGLWLIPDSGGNKVLIATGAGSVYTTAGTYIIGKVSGVDTVFAKFTTDGATMNATNNTQIAHLGYGVGVDSGGGTATAPFYTLGIRKSGSTIGNYSVAVGRDVTASDYASHAEGYNTTSSNYASHAEGNGTTSSGVASHSEGSGTTASYGASHAEGYRTTASGLHSHAEGYQTTSSGNYGSHAEGSETIASGLSSHAEGSGTTASGNDSHASGYGTEASRLAQTAIGQYNVVDGTGATTQGNYALIVGNGSANARSNALTVDWSGNVNIASGAKYKINGTNLSASDVGAVPTSRTVNSKALSSNITLAPSDLSITDYVVAQSQSTTSYGNGYWRWREWNSGKVEIWYHGSLTLNTADADYSGVKRYSRWFNLPNSYSLYRCTCIVNGMQEGAWYGCGGTRDSSNTVGAEPTRSIQVMGYRIQSTPPTAPSNLNIYICGQKTI